jgi:uncharacterized membrane protein
MEKTNSFILRFLKWTSPIAIIAATLYALSKSGDSLFYNFIGIITILWILGFTYIIFGIAFQTQLRNQFIRWITGIKESDEREVYISGQASKNTFILTIAITLLMFFLSVLRVEVSQNKDTSIDGKKNGVIYLGMGLQFLKEAESTSSIDAQKKYYINYNGSPLAADGTLITLLVLQLGSFYYFSRRESLQS